MVDQNGLDWVRSWNDQSSSYSVGWDGNFLVPPGSIISKTIEHCVPAGETFGQIHDAKVDEILSKNVPDWKANIPTMPEAYWQAAKKRRELNAKIAE